MKRDRLLVKRVEEQEQRIGGIIIPDTAKEKPQTAKVVAAGRGRVNDKGDVFPLDVKAITENRRDGQDGRDPQDRRDGQHRRAGRAHPAGPALPALPALPADVLLSINVMDPTTQDTDQQPEPLIPSEPAPPIDSRFLFVDVAALRAKQLRRGARPRLGDDPPPVLHKAERVAMEEVRRGLVLYDVPAAKLAQEGGGA